MFKSSDHESKTECVELPQIGSGFLGFIACTLILAFQLVGCEQAEVETLSVSSDYAPQPIDAKTRIRKPGEILTNSIDMKLVYIPAGSFMMGSSRSAAEYLREFHEMEDHFMDQFPQHQVSISEGFWMGQTEVTQGQYMSVMDAKPWSGKEYVREGASNPAVYVSWDDAVEFCRKLSQQEGKTYKLPTEAEWEYACRAGTKTRFNFGDSDSSLGDHAWFYDNTIEVGQQYAHPVGQKKPNLWGLYDMHGNVYELCSDWYDEGEGTRRMRGGSWGNVATFLRCSFRRGYTLPDHRYYHVGFRVLALGLAVAMAESDFTFGTPMNLGPTVNTSSDEAGPSISADGLSLYFHSDRPGGFGDSGDVDLYVSTRATKDDPWGVSSNLGSVVNSPAKEGTPSISADGLRLYFMSERLGSRDIWVTTRTTKDGAWTTPVNVGPIVNTPHEECCPNISADGLSLFFFSDRPGGSGGRDLWVTTRPTKDDDWTTPTNLGPIVNSPAHEGSPSISADGLSLFFFSHRPGPGGSVDRDLWVTTRTEVSEPWGAPVNLGPKVNTLNSDGGPDLSKDGRTLYFSSDRPGRKGGRDLWQVSISSKGR